MKPVGPAHNLMVMVLVLVSMVERSRSVTTTLNGALLADTNGTGGQGTQLILHQTLVFQQQEL